MRITELHTTCHKRTKSIVIPIFTDDKNKISAILFISIFEFQYSKIMSFRISDFMSY
ncbi:hypothetical protein TASCI_20253 [Tenacibaculum ascidiaceicola]